MKRFIIFGILLLNLSFLLLNCKSAQKTFEKGDYDKTYKLALKNLEKGKSVKSNKALLEKSLDKIIQREERILENLYNSSNLKDWVKATKQIDNLREKIDDSTPYIGNIYDENYTELIDKESELRVGISDTYFTNGQENLTKAIDSGYKHYAQTAYNEFISADKYSENGLGIDSLLDECIHYGTLIYSVEARARFDISHSFEVRQRFDDLEDYGGTFLKIYYDRITSQVDCAIQIDLEDLDFNILSRSDRESFEEEIITGYNTVTDTAGNSTEEPIYETVRGEVDIIENVKVATWEADVDIDSQSKNCDLSDDRFSVRIESDPQTTYQTYGDLRAIPDEYQRNPRFNDLPDDDDMVDIMLDELYNQIVGAYFQ